MGGCVGLATSHRSAQRADRHLSAAALDAQIRPHFLLNALTAVAACVRDRPALAEELLGSLADLVRVILARRDRFVSVAQEIEVIRTYLALERVRLGGRMRTIFDVEPRALALRIPTLAMQTLVENAVVHGAAARAEGATLRVVIRRRRDRLYLVVADDGPGIHAPPRRTGPDEMTVATGLRNVRRRLRAIYGPRAKLRVLHRHRGGTVAAVILPASSTR